MAGVAPLAVAEVTSSADFAGVASPADLAGVFPAVAGVASPAVLAGIAVPAVAGVTSPAVLAGMAVPAVAGAASLAVVEVASSTDRMEAGSLSVCGSRSACDCLIPDDYVTESDVVVLPDGIDWGIQPSWHCLQQGLRCWLLQEAGGTRTWYARMDEWMVIHSRKGWTCRRTTMRPLWSEQLARVLLGV